MQKKVAVIGAGFSGLSAAAYMAKAGFAVEVFEKNSTAGGRARQFTTDNGYVFDMGPSWYWMPDVFERFFADFNCQIDDYYSLKRLNPAFSIVFAENQVVNIPDSYGELRQLFNQMEQGSAKKLDKFMQEAAFKYRVGMQKLVYKPSKSWLEFANWELLKGLFRLQVFQSFDNHINKHFSHPHIKALMSFPILFLGAMPEQTPALYSLMNYAGLKLGTWYTQGGFGSVIKAMQSIAETHHVKFHFNESVTKIHASGKHISQIQTTNRTANFDCVIATADYHHVENRLLSEKYRNYTELYWKKRVFAPSCLIAYLGINKQIPKLHHHNLFFDADFKQHAKEIYTHPAWPTKPLFYVCCPSKTDKTVSPSGCENLFLLMPLAPGLIDTEALREQYFISMMQRLEKYTNTTIVPHIQYKQTYCISDFENDYNAYKGNAYGLANTLFQTANLKPKIYNKKIQNLFYAGQLTVPGPGVPPCIISGKVAASQAIKYLK